MKPNFLDEQLFEFREVLQLLMVERGAVEGYASRGIFTPQFPQKRGGPRSRRTYTGRDIIKLETIASLAETGVFTMNVKPLVEAGGIIDQQIDRYIARRPELNTQVQIHPLLGWLPEYGPADLSKAMRRQGVWNYVVFDPACLVGRLAKTLQEYLRDREAGTVKKFQPSNVAEAADWRAKRWALDLGMIVPAGKSTGTRATARKK
jgi:hypothetical protein